MFAMESFQYKFDGKKFAWSYPHGYLPHPTSNVELVDRLGIAPVFSRRGYRSFVLTVSSRMWLEVDR